MEWEVVQNTPTGDLLLIERTNDILAPFEGTRNMLLISAVFIFFVIAAMGIDLISGIRKAKERGEARTSYGYSRTVNKFILYIGSTVIATFIDLMIHYSHLLYLMKLKPIAGLPVVTCLICIFLCLIEIKSIKENANEKTNKEVEDMIRLIVKTIGTQNLQDIAADKIRDTLIDLRRQ